MLDVATLSWLFANNHHRVTLYCKELDHSDTLIPAPFDPACSINWILGNLVAVRSNYLSFLKEKPVWTRKMAKRYHRGAPAINADGDGVFSLEQLLADFNESQVRLKRGLHRIKPEKLLEPVGRQGETIWLFLLLTQHNEAQRTGQMSILVGLLGKHSPWLYL